MNKVSHYCCGVTRIGTQYLVLRFVILSYPFDAEMQLNNDQVGIKCLFQRGISCDLTHVFEINDINGDRLEHSINLMIRKLIIKSPFIYMVNKYTSIAI